MNSTVPGVSQLSPSATALRTLPSRARAALREMAVQDWGVVGYHLALVLAALQGRPGFHWYRSLAETLSLLVTYALALLVVRGRLLEGTRAEGLIYRIAVVGTVHVSYFTFRNLLPAANPRALDVQLLQLDLSWFGFEPALAVQPFVTPALTEWFSFFYYGYFFFLTAHIVPIVFFSRHRARLGEFTAGLLVVFCVGHLTYLLVPGYGPGVALPNLFDLPLEGGYWYRVMLQTVQAGGAYKDIFPSIHTAVPAFITLWTFRHRQALPYKYTWPLCAFIAVNIILATMYLRWHYLIDVVAGLALAAVSLPIAVLLTRNELARRNRVLLRPVWPETGYFAKH